MRLNKTPIITKIDVRHKPVDNGEQEEYNQVAH